MKEKIASLTIAVPYKRAGNIITQEPVNFDVYKTDDHYTLTPCLSTDERRIANLPEELQFRIMDGEPVSLRGKRDGNFHVIRDAFKKLVDKEQLL